MGPIQLQHIPFWDRPWSDMMKPVLKLCSLCELTKIVCYLIPIGKNVGWICLGYNHLAYNLLEVEIEIW